MQRRLADVAQIIDLASDLVVDSNPRHFHEATIGWLERRMSSAASVSLQVDFRAFPRNRRTLNSSRMAGSATDLTWLFWIKRYEE
jgi:hypothetical protein